MKRNLITAAVASAILGTFAIAPAMADDNASSTEATSGRTAGEAMDDAAIVAKVKAAMLSSSQVEGLDVNVDSRNGIVTLSGSADSMAERSQAEQIAKSADGVKGVDNKIVIKADDAPAAPVAPAPAETPADVTPPAN